MKTTRRRKALMTIFAVGLAALVVDRTFLRPQGGPDAASADSSQPMDGAAVLAENVPVLEEEAAEFGLAERLDTLSSNDPVDFTQMRDAFALPGAWDDSAAAHAMAVADPIVQFVRKHQLTAVVIDGQDSYVLIDDRFLVPGQQIDGFTLVSVGDHLAVFEKDGEQACLELVNK